MPTLIKESRTSECRYRVFFLEELKISAAEFQLRSIFSPPHLYYFPLLNLSAGNISTFPSPSYCRFWSELCHIQSERERKWILNMVDLQNQLRTSYNQVMLAVLILICLFLEFFASIVFLVWDFVWKWKSSLKIRATCNLSVYTKCEKKMPNAKKKKKNP